jgi:hypothetical protein
MDFKTFLEQQEFVEFAQQQFATPGVQPVQPVADKPWSAKKSEILNFWKNLRGDIPVIITPMREKGDGHYQSYGEDGLRVTGSWEFISSILGRLKEILAYENPQTKLRLVFRGVDKSHSRPDKQTYVFYVNLQQREHGRAGRPKKIGLSTKGTL